VFYLSLKNWETRTGWLDLARKEGLFYTFHAPFSDDYDIALFEPEKWNMVYRRYSELLDTAADFVQRTTGSSRINFHGAGNRAFSLPQLIDKTVFFIEWLDRERAARTWPFEFVLELLPYNAGKKKAGDCVPELLMIEKRVRSALTGFCWDFGHHRLNELLGHEASLGGEFLPKVRHVHIHDIKDVEKEFDHVPLNYGTVPYEHYLDLLRGQDLHMVLELNYEHTQQCGEPEKELLASLQKLHGLREKEKR